MRDTSPETVKQHLAELAEDQSAPLETFYLTRALAKRIAELEYQVAELQDTSVDKADAWDRNAKKNERIRELEAASEYNHSPVDDEIDGVLFRFWARAGSFPGGWPYDTMRAIAYCKTPDEYRTALLKLANEKGVNLPTPPRNT